MPQAIPVVLAFAKTAIGKILISTAINIGIGALQAKLNQPKGPKPRDLQTQIRSGAADRIQHFGRVRTSGTLVFSDYRHFAEPLSILGMTFPAGTRRAYVLLAISTGGISGVDRWYLDGTPVSVDGQGYVTTPPWNGGKVRLRLRTGLPPEQEGGHWPELHAAFPTRWIAGQHRLEGVATILGEFDAVKPEEINETYPGGRPPEISAVIRGVPCHEPATGNASFTTNPIRHLLHYLSDAGSGAIPIAEFDLSHWFTAIADCNDLLPTSGGTRPRYSSGGSYALGEPVKDVAARILESVGGELFLTQDGRIGVRVAKWRAPTAVIEDRKIVSLDCGPGRSKLDRVTTLVPEYVEPSLDYTETTADPWEDPRAIARFGEPKPRELSLLPVQHHGQARALAKIAAARENPRVTASLSLRFWGLRLLGEERAFLHRPDRGLDMVPARIVGVSLDLAAPDGVVKVELESDDAATYGWTAPEEGAMPSAPARSVNGRQPIDAPVIEAITLNTEGDALYLSGTIPPLDGYSSGVQFRLSSGGPWSNAEFNQENGYFRTPDLADGNEYDLRGRRFLAGLTALNWQRGTDVTRYSPWTFVNGIGIVADQTPPDPPELIAATVVGNRLEITFAPDLGANYRRTGIWRGTGSFAEASFIRWYYDLASSVEASIALSATPQRYWLRSGNGSGVSAAPVDIGTY